MKKLSFAAILLLCMSIVGCHKEPEPQPEEEQTLSVTPTSLSFDNKGGSQTISISTNKSWTISSTQNWCKFSQTSGNPNDNTLITIFCDENTTYADRSCSLTIKADALSETIDVKQGQKEGLYIEQSKYSVTEEAQTLEIKVNTNISDFNVTADTSCEDWITYVRTKALSESVVTLTIAENEGEERVGKVKISKGELYEEVTITQSAVTFVEFEDDNFKAYCVENFDKNGDGEISKAEALMVQKIEVSTNVISSLGGIEYFVNLTHLSCLFSFHHAAMYSNNRWRYYDEQGCEIWSRLKSLDLSKNTALIHLSCPINKLTFLDVSNNPALEFLDCSYNELIALNVSNDMALYELDCSNNKLTTLDVSDNIALYDLNCNSNQLSSLEVSNNTALTRFDCQLNQIESLDLSKNINLKIFACAYNLLGNLDMSNNTKLTYLDCHSNKFSWLDVSNNTALEYLDCSSNKIQIIYVWKGFFEKEHTRFYKDDSAKYVEKEE